MALRNSNIWNKENISAVSTIEKSLLKILATHLYKIPLNKYSSKNDCNTQKRLIDKIMVRLMLSFNTKSIFLNPNNKRTTSEINNAPINIPIKYLYNDLFLCFFDRGATLNKNKSRVK